MWAQTQLHMSTHGGHTTLVTVTVAVERGPEPQGEAGQCVGESALPDAGYKARGSEKGGAGEQSLKGKRADGSVSSSRSRSHPNTAFAPQVFL